MTVRILTTASSVWTIDEEAKQFRRDPRREGTRHPNPNLVYIEGWLPYKDFEVLGDGRMIFYFDYSHPDYGTYVVTGRPEEWEEV